MRKEINMIWEGKTIDTTIESVDISNQINNSKFRNFFNGVSSAIIMISLDAAALQTRLILVIIVKWENFKKYFSKTKNNCSKNFQKRSKN